MEKSKKLIGVSLLSVMVLAACGEDSAQEAGAGDGEDFYDENDLEMIVPTSPGGGSDIQARFMAPFLSEHVPGSPDVQVVNIAGGGTITGSNEFALMREPDGESSLWGSISTTTAYLLDEEGVEYDYDNFTPVLGYPDGGVVYVSESTGIEGPEEILEAEEELVYGGTSATGLPLTILLSFEVLGLDVDGIFGYESSGPARVAFEQGETNVDFQTTSSYVSNVEPMVEDGDALPMYTIGQIDEDGELVRDPQFPDLPTVKEVYMDIYGEEPSGEAWEAYKAFVGAVFTVQKVLWVHDDIPEEALNELVEGAETMVEDEEYQQEGEEVMGYEPFVGQEIQEMMPRLLDLPEGTEDWVKQFLNENYDLEQ
ncbi:hypothetical protein [Alkalicoccus saliphilus]|uniref:Tricarboxylate transporter n=1 Tax=Alkalicoccus saliphilus TaxID=200989 RepID=A0A2T4U6U5_9BACI|nr:hypothetical protein [Alkalicoccus saliphilus]PTL39133.1 hypothetical protein C6Y45_08115 [Alkalicoccus saliphilus]